MTSKGFKTEELMRNYFLKAGFFVVRGINVQVKELDLTDADLWIYERSATFARRRTIIDIKDKKRPQAAERMFFVKGLSEVLGVEGAGIVTTDNNPVLRDLARRNKILWIDGNDVQRIKTNKFIESIDRLSEEEFLESVDELDQVRGGKAYRHGFEKVKTALGDRFGISSANIALDNFGQFARSATKTHPNTESAKSLIRLSYYTASIAAISLDFSSADTALRPSDERLKHMSSAIRYGDDQTEINRKMMWLELALNSVDNGSSVFNQVNRKFRSEAESIPAEDLAQIVVKYSSSDTLFEVARTLEQAAFDRHLASFDHLPIPVKSFLGALLDFSGCSREVFSKVISPSEYFTNSRDNRVGEKQMQFKIEDDEK
ncbi:hypothetical protein ACD631_12165 [Alteromonas macleodii]|uniref:hypothetical protein n=1 Tax=Alteromonas macleodii TaxID=28108 RepID=UPI002076BAE7|nr:hypothetical protein [Alteromonas macleodii]USI27131.1 hypothetical protein NFG60_15620 [Alteromonas macleodii]